MSLHTGYHLCYSSELAVWHSHDLTLIVDKFLEFPINPLNKLLYADFWENEVSLFTLFGYLGR